MEVDSYFRFVIALIAVLGVIVALAAAARHLGIGYGGKGRKGSQRRLAISEILPIDAKRRLVLIQRDGNEHLILVGPEGDTVIETGIDEAEAIKPSQRTANLIKVVPATSQGEPT